MSEGFADTVLFITSGVVVTFILVRLSGKIAAVGILLLCITWIFEGIFTLGLLRCPDSLAIGEGAQGRFGPISTRIGVIDDRISGLAFVFFILFDLLSIPVGGNGAEGLDNVVTLSTLRGSEFKQAYGVNIVDGVLAGLTARAVVVLDEANKVLHAELVDEITHEPNYDAVLKALA